MVSQVFFAKVLSCTRVMRAFPTTLVKLPVDVIFYVLGIVARIFYLYESTLHYAEWAATRRRQNALCSNRTINNVRTSSVLYSMSFLVEITRNLDSTLNAESGLCWYRYVGKNIMFNNKMCVKIS
jgi:hypothetical protein